LKKSKKKELAIDIGQAGNYGRDIYNGIVNGLDLLEPVDGRIFVEVDLMLSDNNLFKDDELRKAKLVIEVKLGKKQK
jgi:hypothetical protein